MRNLKITGYLFLIVIFLVGCNEILVDVEPSVSVSGEVVVSTPEGIEALRASMYGKLRARFFFATDYFVAPSAMADETRNRSGSSRYNNLNRAVGTDGGTVHIGTSLAPGAWVDAYSLILDANVIASAIPEGVIPEATQNRYRGEALAIRAFAMHHLVRTKGYEPGRAVGGWNLGIIIRTEPTLNEPDADMRARSTVADVYTQILTDLAEAKQLLAGINTDNTRITEAFVDALTARVNLYAGNWAAAATAAQSAINNSGRVLVNTPEGVAGMFNERQGNHPEAIFKLVIDPDTESFTRGGNFINEGPAAYTGTQWVAQVPTQMVIDKYEDIDYRLGWYEPCFNYEAGSAQSGCDVVNENGWMLNKFIGVKGNTVDDFPYIRVAEMYLIHAEASARASGPAAGAASLNALRNARGLGDVDASALASMAAFENEILDERIRELILEGHRFFDLKRLGRDVMNPDGSTKIRYDSYRILAPIGDQHTGVNPLLEENPGY